MADHNNPSPMAATYRRVTLPTDNPWEVTRQSIYELVSKTHESQSHAERTRRSAEPPVAEAMKWVERKASIIIESIEAAKSRLDRDDQDRKRYKEDFNGNAAFLLNLIEVRNLSKAQQDDARIKIQEMTNTFTNLRHRATEIQIQDFEQTRELMRGVGVAYAAALPAKGPPTKVREPSKAKMNAQNQEEQKDERSPARVLGQRRGGIRPAPLILDKGKPLEHVNLVQVLSSRMDSSAAAGKSDKSPAPDHGEEGETQGSHGKGQASQAKPVTLGYHAHNPVGGEPADIAKASGTTSVDHKGKAPSPVHPRVAKEAGHCEPDYPAAKCFDETGREHQRRRHPPRKERVVIYARDGYQQELYFPGTPTFLSWRENINLIIPDAHEATSDMLLEHDTLDDSATPDNVTAVLAPSPASSKAGPEAPPGTVVDHNGETHHDPRDGHNLSPPASSAGSASIPLAMLDSGIILNPATQSSAGGQVGPANQSPNGSQSSQRRKRSPLFRESFLVEKIDPSWSPRLPSGPEGAGAGDWLSVPIALFDASSWFFLDQLLPWLHVVCFLGTLAYACLYSGVEMCSAPIKNVFLRFKHDLANPLPAPVISEVPERSRLVVATHLMVALGSWALFTAYRLEGLRQSWMEANGMTRVLFVDYLRSVGRRSWHDLAPMLLGGFDMNQSHVIGKLHA